MTTQPTTEKTTEEVCEDTPAVEVAEQFKAQSEALTQKDPSAFEAVAQHFDDREDTRGASVRYKTKNTWPGTDDAREPEKVSICVDSIHSDLSHEVMAIVRHTGLTMRVRRPEQTNISVRSTFIDLIPME